MECEPLPPLVTLSDDSADEGHGRPPIRKRKAQHLGLEPEVHLRATLGKRCTCKNACMDKFAGKTAFQELLVSRKTWRELHKLDQDSVVPGLIDNYFQRNFFYDQPKAFKMMRLRLIFPRFSTSHQRFVYYTVNLINCVQINCRWSVLWSVAQVFQSMRDRKIAKEKGWKMLGKPVCLKAWKRLQGIGCLPFLQEGFHKGPLNFGWYYCVLFFFMLISIANLFDEVPGDSIG